MLFTSWKFSYQTFAKSAKWFLIWNKLLKWLRVKKILLIWNIIISSLELNWIEKCAMLFKSENGFCGYLPFVVAGLYLLNQVFRWLNWELTGLETRSIPKFELWNIKKGTFMTCTWICITATAFNNQHLPTWTTCSAISFWNVALFFMSPHNSFPHIEYPLSIDDK